MVCRSVQISAVTRTASLQSPPVLWCPEDQVFCSFNGDMTHAILTQQQFSISTLVPASVRDIGAHILVFAETYTVAIMLILLFCTNMEHGILVCKRCSPGLNNSGFYFMNFL